MHFEIKNLFDMGNGSNHILMYSKMIPAALTISN